MECPSLTDEVRFRTSPDIADDGNAAKSYSWTRSSGDRRRRSPTGEKRKTRLQAIVNQDGLIELDLSQRALSSIPAEVYTMMRVEVLKVNDNNIRGLASGLSNLHRLKVLHAQRNQISFVHDTIANCVHLHELDLSANKLTIVPRSVGMLRSLKVLKLSNNQLEMLPHELGDLSALHQLELDGNRLWHLPASFTKLQNARHVNLSRNRFDQLPVCVCGMRRLRGLDAHGNQLRQLPPEFAGLRALEELSLAANQLRSLPPAIFTLRHLHSLDVSDNQLHSVPHRLAQLPALRMLVVQGNQLVSLPTNLETLHYLNVARNKFQNLSVIRMRQLRYLNAGHNVLENMPLGVYNLLNLEILKLNNNNIGYLSQDIALLKKLRVLDLSHNELVSLPQVIDELSKLEVFNIKGNKITERTLLGGGTEPGTGPQPPGSAPAAMPQVLGGNPECVASGREPNQAYGQHKEVADNVNTGRSGDQRHQGSPGHYQNTAPTPKHYRKKHSFRRRGLPVYRTRSQRKKAGKPKEAKKHFFSARHKKNNSAEKSPQYHQVATQYTPRSTVRSRDQPVLERVQSTPASIYASTNPGSAAWVRAGLPSTLHHSLQSLNISKNNALARNDPFALSEISYPVVHTPVPRPSADDARPSNQQPATPNKQASASYTNDWINERNYECGSGSSNSVTINEPIGDNLSLGEDDFEFVPTNIPDRKLMRLCHEAESLLNTELLRPLQINKGIFKKSLNEGGTLRTLHGITGESSIIIHSDSDPDEQADHVVHVSKDIFFRRAKDMGDNRILRLKMDVFRVTPGGGLFKSTVDPNISLYFPINAVSRTVAVTMQIERINPEAVDAARRLYRSVRTLLAVGDIVHVKQSRDVDFNQQVTMTVPCPALLYRGSVHLVTYRDDNTCTPCTTQYHINNGYISLQTWHFSGRGAVLTRTKDKYRACKAMEQLLQHLYI